MQFSVVLRYRLVACVLTIYFAMPFSNPFRRPKKDKSHLGKPKAATESNNAKTISNTVNDIQEETPKEGLKFHVQLAHGSPTQTINGFSSIHQLYARIANVFDISKSEIIFCTLNTHKCDMEHLIGGQIGLEDFIFVHVAGERKLVTMAKTEPALGITITDNGAGHAFVKRIKEESIAAKTELMKPGDLIEAIEEHSTIGCRHFQVAKTLKEIPLGKVFTMSLIEPKKAFDMISQRSGANLAVSSKQIGTGKATLRLRSQGPATIEAMPTETQEKSVKKIDDLLDNFLGIRDMELSTTIWESGKNKNNPDEFITALNDQLGDFGFPQEFLFDVWGVVLDSRNTP